MAKYKVLRPIAYFGRREVGETVDLNKEYAERYKDFIKPAKSKKTENKSK